MNAITLIQTLTYTRATETKIGTATNVLNELYRLKKSKQLPFLCVRRAIRIQERIVKGIQE
jgi:hypothetical protein